MNESPCHKLSFIIIPADIPIISADEYTFIINVPKSLTSNLLRLGIFGFDKSPELKFWLNIVRIHFAVIGWSIEQLFKVKDFSNGRNTNFEFVTDDKQFCGTVVKFDMFKFERESNKSQRFAILNAKDLT